jgi:hypothetical protein
VGINGAKMIPAVKLTKKINARKSKTGSWERNPAKLLSALFPDAEFCEIVFKINIPYLN